MKKIEEEIEIIKKEKEEFIKCQNFEKAAELRDKQKEKEEKLEKEKQKWENKNGKEIKTLTQEEYLLKKLHKMKMKS